jgi:UDP-N-acetylmuramoylalanine--D-glutamate ligase
VRDLPVAGMHNAVNALAALALGHAIGLPVTGMLDGLRRFRGLPHRLEEVAEIGGVTFYDDSKGTNVGATVAALNGMAAPVVLVAGGDGKGQDFAPLAPAVAARARAVVLIGRDADRIAAVLADCGIPLLRAATLEAAIDTAYAASRPGDAVLLSPACASYDMFRSYVHRGQVFVQAVQALAARVAAGGQP